jgi:hypothetical protein
MIVFDLQCDQGHGFEGWFDSLEDLDAQRKRKLVTCPVCGSGKVRRVPSSFGLAKRRAEPDQEMASRLLGQALTRHLRENFEDVGAGFANEALKIHYGVSPSRNIRGVSTPREEDVLKKEGVEFFKFAQPAPESKPEEGED